jgi:lambda repressor-like predicted transcriptional regulator
MSIPAPAPAGRPSARPSQPGTGRSAARAHTRRLRGDGSTYRQIATAAGLAPATVHDLVSGHRRPTRGTTAAILTVTSDDITPGRLDADGTTHQNQTWKPNHDHDPRQP